MFWTIFRLWFKAGSHVNLFVHSSVNDRQKLFDEYSNFGPLCFKVINCPFLQWNFYLDILVRIVFNYCDKYILPTLLSDLSNNCRNYTIDRFNCHNMKKNKVKEIVFEAALKLSKQLVEHACMSVDSFFIIDVYNNSKQGVGFRNQYLTIEKGQDE